MGEDAKRQDPRQGHDAPRGSRRTWWRLLLVLPFIGTLWVPFYDAVEPRLGGVPYFYWYQFLWIALSAGLTAVVYFVTVPRDPEAGDGRR